MIQWTAELSRRLVCTPEERRGLIPIMTRLTGMAQAYEEGGIEALALAAKDSGEALLYVGIDLIAEGIIGEALEDILATYLAVSPDDGFAFLKTCIIAEGLCGIADGELPATFTRRLAAWFGAEESLPLLPATALAMERRREAP